MILNFIKEVQSNAKYLCEGSIELYNNNLKLVQAINNDITKVSNGACDRGLSICEIIDTIKSMQVRIHTEYANGRAKKKKEDNFVANPGLFLMRDCNRLAKETRVECKQTNEEKIYYCRKVAIKRDGILLDKAIGKVVRIIDAETNEIDYLVSKFSNNWKLVDYKVRTIFYKDTTAGVLKCSSSFNHHIK